MSTSDRSADIAAVRAHMLARLGIDILEYHDPEELLDRWLSPGSAEGKSVAEVAENIARRFYYKYDLEWMPVPRPSRQSNAPDNAGP